MNQILAMIIYILSIGLIAFQWIIVIWALMSWFPGLRDSQVVHFIARLANIVVGPIQRIVPPLGMIDFSAIVALILLNLAQQGLKFLTYALM